MDKRTFKKPYKHRLASRKDYSHAKTFGVTLPQSLPAELIKMPVSIVNQGALPSCTAAASCTARSIMTGRAYDDRAQWGLELAYEGVTNADGFPLDVPASVGKDIGFAPVVVGIPTGSQGAPIDKVGGYFWVQKLSGMDWFDTLCTVQYQLFQQTGKIIPFQFGINWYANWEASSNGYIPTENVDLLGGHDTTWAGYKTFPDGVRRGCNPNSWGIGVGDSGVFWFDRAATNANIGKFGVFYWLDIEDMPSKVKELGLFAQILQNIKAIYEILIAIKKTTPPAPIIAPDEVIPPPAPPIGPQYDFSNPISARHSVRVICDEEGLPLAKGIPVSGSLYALKDILCACIDWESGFNNKIVHPNENKYGQVTSTDYGICQINDYWHIGPGKEFPSGEYVLANPEACVRWMARQFKAGKQSQWVSYTSGEYKRFL